MRTPSHSPPIQTLRTPLNEASSQERTQRHPQHRSPAKTSRKSLLTLIQPMVNDFLNKRTSQVDEEPEETIQQPQLNPAKPTRLSVDEVRMLISQIYTRSVFGERRHWKLFSPPDSLFSFEGLMRLDCSSDLEKVLQETMTAIGGDVPSEIQRRFEEVCYSVDFFISDDSRIKKLITEWISYGLFLSKISATEVVKPLFFTIMNSKRKYRRQKTTIKKLRVDIKAFKANSRYYKMHHRNIENLIESNETLVKKIFLESLLAKRVLKAKQIAYFQAFYHLTKQVQLQVVFSKWKYYNSQQKCLKMFEQRNKIKKLTKFFRVLKIRAEQNAPLRKLKVQARKHYSKKIFYKWIRSYYIKNLTDRKLEKADLFYKINLVNKGIQGFQRIYREYYHHPTTTSLLSNYPVLQQRIHHLIRMENKEQFLNRPQITIFEKLVLDNHQKEDLLLEVRRKRLLIQMMNEMRLQATASMVQRYRLKNKAFEALKQNEALNKQVIGQFQLQILNKRKLEYSSAFFAFLKKKLFLNKLFKEYKNYNKLKIFKRDLKFKKTHFQTWKSVLKMNQLYKDEIRAVNFRNSLLQVKSFLALKTYSKSRRNGALRMVNSIDQKKSKICRQIFNILKEGDWSKMIILKVRRKHRLKAALFNILRLNHQLKSIQKHFLIKRHFISWKKHSTSQRRLLPARLYISTLLEKSLDALKYNVIKKKEIKQKNRECQIYIFYKKRRLLRNILELFKERIDKKKSTQAKLKKFRRSKNLKLKHKYLQKMKSMALTCKNQNKKLKKYFKRKIIKRKREILSVLKRFSMEKKQLHLKEELYSGQKDLILSQRVFLAWKESLENRNRISIRQTFGFPGEGLAETNQ